MEFTATFEDGSRLSTVGVLYFNLLESTLPPSGIKNGYVIASVPFKGYGTNDPTLPGYIKYRVFYHNVNGTPVANLLKPIIIIDGFDPGDKRQIQDSDPHPGKTNTEHVSIEEMMTYYNSLEQKEFLIPILRDLGYDVVIVNHPKYQMNGVDIDGGADYIERNALAHVKLYQELNAELAQNNSTEKLVIVGPSMGGQISRYALAYMEKNNIPTNTRLWVSVDSPHLGANIPVGAQTLLNMLNDYADSAEAEDFVNNQLGSPAAKQQLIEQYKPGSNDYVSQDWLNARTVSQGYNENRGHPFFMQYYNNLYGNGLYGSKGYPQNLRKIALVNGSLTNTKAFANPFSPGGTNFITPYLDNYSGNGAQVFKMEGDANVIGHIVTMETYFMPAMGTNHKIAYYKQKKFLGWNYHDRFISNYNSRGNMDNIPGGWFPTQRDLTYSVETSTPCDWVGFHEPNWGGYICVNDWNLQTLKHVNSFIPTVSSLGFKNPDFNWAQEFDRNLVCTGEIPFDSYFGPRNNEQHTSFSEESITWLLAELAGNPQPPIIYLDGNDISGPTKICNGTTATYSFPTCKSKPVQSWQYSTNLLNLVSSTYTSISVQPKNSSSSGLGFIKAIYPNQTIQKEIWIGSPNFNFDLEWDAPARMVIVTAEGPNGSDISLQGITSMTWEVVGSSGGGYSLGGNCSGLSCIARGPANSNNWSVDYKVTAISSCGTTIKYITATPPPPLVSTEAGTYDFISYPNNLYIINYIEEGISLPVENFKNPEADFKISVYDFSGNKVMETTETRIDITRLRTGIYILKAVVANTILTKKVFK